MYREQKGSLKTCNHHNKRLCTETSGKIKNLYLEVKSKRDLRRSDGESFKVSAGLKGDEKPSS